jgi:hypothetical protein
MAGLSFETFDSPGHQARFPGLRLAWEALAAPPGTTAALNAANEIAVAAFLDANPGYRKPAAATVVAMLSASGRQEKACRFLMETFAIPTADVLNPRAASSEASPDVTGSVPKDPLAAAKFYLARGNDVTALRFLGEASGAGGGDAAEALRLQAALEMRSGDWSKASNTLLAYLRATGQL